MSDNTLQHAKDILFPKATNVAQQLTDENISQSFTTDAFLIGGITRNVIYRYATISGRGNITFHQAQLFNLVDNTQYNARYKYRGTWVSVNTNSQQSKTDSNVYYNSNPGILKMLNTTTLPDGSSTKTNPYNCLTLSDAKVKGLIVPSTTDLTPELYSTISNPILKLAKRTQQVALLQTDEESKTKEYKLAYEEYAHAVYKLVEEGLLMFVYGLINPTQSSISISLKLNTAINQVSNPWLNASNILGQSDLHLSDLPSTNIFRGLVEVSGATDLEALSSDNIQMLGEKTVSRSGDVARLSISKVATIRDFTGDTNILVSLVDPIDSTRSRVEPFKKQLESGNNVFFIEGTLSPVVRLLDGQSSRNGNVFFELKINRYNVHNSNNNRRSLESDSFGDLQFEEVSIGDAEIEYSGEDNTSTEESNTQSTQHNSDMI